MRLGVPQRDAVLRYRACGPYPYGQYAHGVYDDCRRPGRVSHVPRCLHTGCEPPSPDAGSDQPPLTFTDINVNLPGQQFFALQSALATQIVVPPSLLLALLILLCICGMTLMAMVRIVTLPLLDQTLRLNED